jgi:adenylate kinase
MTDMTLEPLEPIEPTYIILLGPPGSGKGTQAARLREEFDLPHVASGDLFRHNLNNETELGLQAQSYMDRGELVPDEITIAMVMDRLSQPDCAKGAILDGFPRTLVQAEALDEALEAEGHTVDVVPLIQVPDEVVVERLSGRLICRECQATFHKTYNPFESCPYNKCNGEYLYQRDDDKPETVRSRLEVYWEQTSPLIDYYRNQGVLVEINGDQAMEAVEKDLIAAIKARTRI